MAPNRTSAARQNSDSSLVSDDKALELLLRHRERAIREARESKAQATTALAQAEKTAAEYQTKVRDVLSSYQARIDELIKLQAAKETEFENEVPKLLKQMSAILEQHAHLLTSTVTEIEELHRDCDLQCQRLAFFKDGKSRW
ncbi:hypothetical protein OIV83_005350 [Microbotryomycetes sp. JL201]|nr:hypothetical protein OIV83_005350 [Microbotryomycetes sp. JL201]